mmetsp:Transcript_16946/g.43518  ORF Transcript_16946/g.43518 Transcript_16946/m.43518 type:complete len:106 (-) Transcript_16946:722-1039(-)
MRYGRYRAEANAIPKDIKGHPSDPLVWWSKRRTHFPRLFKIAKRLLAIPASSAPSERVFSLASLVLTRLRGRLDPTVAGYLIFVKRHADSYGWDEAILGSGSSRT